MLAHLIAYARGIARRRMIRVELDDELQFHVEQETESLIARGVPPEDARRQAMHSLGGLLQTREAVWDVRTLWFDRLWRDLAYAVRSLRSTPAFTAVAIVIVMLSIGASTAIYSVVDGVMLRPLPYPESDRLVVVGEFNIETVNPATSANQVAPQNFYDWREQQTVFAGLGAIITYPELTLLGEPGTLGENVRTPMVTADFFSVLQATPILGRTLTTNDELEGSPRVVVISHRLWQQRFGGRHHVIGRSLRTPRVSFEIVGVMPSTFVDPFDATGTVAAWVPYVITREDRIRGNSFGYNLRVVGRLRDDVTIEQAQAQMTQITARLAAETPRWFTDRVALVEPLHHHLTRGVWRWMLLLLTAVACVMLIACVNLANLLLARASSRRRELAVRAALGGSRWDVARVLLVESVLLSLSGTLLGLIVAWWGVEAIRGVMPPEVPRLHGVAINARVLAMATLAAVITGLAFGLAPALKFSRGTANGLLASSERRSTGDVRTSRLRQTLVAAEVALAVVLLVGSGLFLASFARLLNVDLGIDHRDVLTVQVRVLEMPANFQQFAERNRALLTEVLDRVRGVGGVEVAALHSGGLPLRGDLRTVTFGIPSRELPRNTDIALNQVSPDFFAAVRMRLVAGRLFTDTDHATGEAVVILNQAAASSYFPNVDPLGQVVHISRNPRVVVGIVSNTRHEGPEAGWRTQAYIPVAQSSVAGATLIVRTAPSSAGVLPAVRQTIQSVCATASVPVRVDEATLERFFNGVVAQRRFNMLLLTLFGALGLVIAAAGIYGVMSYEVSQQTQEIGVRMALGASPGSVLRSVLAHATRSLAVGLALGVAGAWALATLVESFLFQIEPHDPVVYGGALLLLAATGLAAAGLPARRAAHVDPLVAIRMD